MRRLNAALGLFLFVPIAGCWTSVDGNGQPAMETRALDGFVAVDNEGAFDVRVEQGDTFSVGVNIDSNLLRFVETRVVGSTLEIGSHQHLETHLPGPHVTVKMPSLTAASLSGSGRMAVLSFQQTHAVALRLEGSGNVDFAGTASSVDVNVSGSGDVALAGSTDRLSVGLAGSGFVDAANLPASAGSIDLSGSGNVRATINGPADVALRGSGDIDLYGDVSLQRSSKSGSGSIRVHK